jgi:GNAT superfamily N-acetyltransferase
MSMQPAVRPLDHDDVEALLPLVRAFSIEDGHHFDAERVRGGLEGLLERPWFGTTLVLAEGDHLLGYAVVTLGWSLESGGLDALLDEVYLDPSRRGRGTGSALIERAVEQARALGARRIYLEVEAANSPARRLYERLGWQPEDSQMLLRWLTQPPAPPG